MTSKLYIGNLQNKTADVDLESLFSQAGKVKSAQVIRDRESGRSKGFAFVEMSSSDEANAAINMFHGKDFNGRPLTVNIARPREERSGGGFRGGGRDHRRRLSDDLDNFGPQLGGDATTEAPPPKLSGTSSTISPPPDNKKKKKTKRK